MKKKILGVAVILGIAGAVAFKTNSKSVTYYFKDPTNNNTCTSQLFDVTPCPTPANIDCTKDFGGLIGVQQLYTAINCLTKVKRS